MSVKNRTEPARNTFAEAKRWCGNHRGFAAAVLFAAIAIVVGTVVSFSMAWSANRKADLAGRERDSANKRATESDQQRSEATTSEYFALISDAAAQLELGNIAMLRASLNRCVPGEGEEDRRGWEWNYLDRASRGAMREFAAGDEGQSCFSLALSPDAKRLATGAGAPPIRSTRPDSRGSLRIWDVESGELAIDLGLEAGVELRGVRNIAFHPSGALLASSEMNWRGGRNDKHNGPIRIWDLERRELMQAIPMRRVVYQLEFIDNGQFMVVRVAGSAEKPSETLAWKVDEQGLYRRLKDPNRTPVPHIVSQTALGEPRPNQDRSLWAIRAASYRSAIVLNSQGEQLAEFQIPNGRVDALAFHPSGDRLAIANSRSAVEIYNISTHKRLARIRHHGPVNSVAFSRSGDYLMTGGEDGKARLWDAKREPDRLLLHGSQHPLTEVSFDAMDFRAAGRLVAFRSQNGQLLEFDVQTGALLSSKTIALRRSPDEPRRTVQFSRNGERLIGLAPERDALQVWNVADAKQLAEFPLPSPADSLAISPDGQFIAALGKPERGVPSEGDDLDATKDTIEVGIWNVDTRAKTSIRRSNDDGGQVEFIRFGPKGMLAMVGFQSENEEEGFPAAFCDVWSSKNGEPAGSRSTDRRLNAIAFNRDGSRLAAADDKHLMLWDLRTGEEFYKSPLPDLITDLAFFAEGSRIAGSSRERTYVWDAATGRQLIILQGPPRENELPFRAMVRVSPDNKVIVANQWDDAIYAWDGNTSTDSQPRSAD